MKLYLNILLLGVLLAGTGRAAEVIPAAPSQYFNDYAHVVSPVTAQQLNQTLEDFERATSIQALVVVYPKMQSDSSIEDYTVRVAQSWKVGQKVKKNGVVLFVFIQDRRMRIEVGYGLEGALPDALAKRIIDDEIAPYFKQGNYDAGLTAGVRAILQATRGEYKGTGRTVADNRRGRTPNGLPIALLVFFLLAAAAAARRRHGTIYGGGGRSYWWGWGGGGWGGGWGGGGGGGGGGFSGGGFSGGGGSFGGGGASGSW